LGIPSLPVNPPTLSREVSRCQDHLRFHCKHSHKLSTGIWPSDHLALVYFKKVYMLIGALTISVYPICPGLALTFIPSLLFSREGLRGERKLLHPSGILHSSHSEHFICLYPFGLNFSSHTGHRLEVPLAST